MLLPARMFLQPWCSIAARLSFLSQSASSAHLPHGIQGQMQLAPRHRCSGVWSENWSPRAEAETAGSTEMLDFLMGFWLFCVLGFFFFCFLVLFCWFLFLCFDFGFLLLRIFFGFFLFVFVIALKKKSLWFKCSWETETDWRKEVLCSVLETYWVCVSTVFGQVITMYLPNI